MALVESRRHSRADLSLWRKLEMADRLTYGLRKVEDKAQRGIEVIKGFCRAGGCYCAASWGKDSSVVAHLLWRAGQESPYAKLTPTYRIRMEGIETPGTDAVEEEFLARWPLIFRRVESPHNPAWEREQDKREMALETGIEQCRQLVGTARYINGLRGDESPSRAWRIRRGLAWGHSCSPIGRWDVADVWAYLANHDLPVHPNYAMTAGGDWPRDKLRVCMLGNWKGRRMGRLLWERQYYGDVLGEMKATHPNMVP